MRNRKTVVPAKLQKIDQSCFPESEFYRHLELGTDWYRKHGFGRALEEWIAAGKLRSQQAENPVALQDCPQYGGQVETLPVLFLLELINSHKLEGAVLYHNRDSAVKLFFKGGLLSHASTNHDDHRLGRLIVKHGFLSEKDLALHVREANTRAQKVGEYVVAQKNLTQPILQDLLLLQIKRILGNLLSWKSGQFVFRRGQIAHASGRRYSPLSIACAAARIHFSFTRFKTQIPGPKTIFRHSPHIQGEEAAILSKLKPEYRFIFSIIDGVRNIDQLARFAGVDTEGVIAVLYRLNLMGLIRRSKEVVEYEDVEFNEFNRTIEVLLEIYALLAERLFAALGARTDEIVDDVYGNLEDTHRLLLNGTIEKGSAAINKQTLLYNIAMNCPSAHQRANLLNAAGAFFSGLLETIQTILGNTIVAEAADEIDKISSGIERFSMDPASKKRLRNTLADLTRNYVSQR